MREQYDYIIVGAGAMGSSTAYELAKRGAGRILLIDRSGAGSGATGQAAGLIRHHYMQREVVEMAAYSAGKLEHFEEETGYSIDYVKNRFLYIEPHPADEMRPVFEMQRALGVRTRLLTPDEMADIHPRGQMNTEGTGCGFYEEDGAYADPYKLAAAYAAGARVLGAELKTGEEFMEIIEEDGRAAGIRTNRGTYYGGTVILAAGLSMPDVISRLGLSMELIYLPLGHAVLIPDRPFEPDILTVCDASDPRSMFFIRPENGGTVLLGTDFDETPAPIRPEKYYHRYSYARLVEYFRHLTKRFPFLLGYRLKTVFAALDVRTADWNPGIGWFPGDMKGLYLMFGGSGHCFKLSPAIGRYAAEELLGETPSFDTSVFSIGRLIGKADEAGGFFRSE